MSCGYILKVHMNKRTLLNDVLSYLFASINKEVIAKDVQKTISNQELSYKFTKEYTLNLLHLPRHLQNPYVSKITIF